jgi:manganese/iron transport system substrate-binding protein
MRWLTLLSALLLAAVAALPASAQQAPRKLLVCSTTQVADFARQIVGDRWRVVSILKPGQDPHLYEIKPGDAELVRQADLCAHNGWHLEGKDWMKLLADEQGKKIITCVEGVQPYVLKEGEGKRPDPHAWFSPLNAAVYVRNLLQGISAADPGHKAEYESRADLYNQQLRALHVWAQKQISAVPPDRRVLVTSHDAFNYFCLAYGFKPAAPVAWSTGDEVGAGLTQERKDQTVAEIRASRVKAIFVETSVNEKVIREIANDAGVKVGGRLYSDSMGEPGSAGESYLGMLRENVLTIVEALK